MRNGNGSTTMKLKILLYASQIGEMVQSPFVRMRANVIKKTDMIVTIPNTVPSVAKMLFSIPSKKQYEN